MHKPTRIDEPTYIAEEARTFRARLVKLQQQTSCFGDLRPRIALVADRIDKLPTREWLAAPADLSGPLKLNQPDRQALSERRNEFYQAHLALQQFINSMIDELAQEALTTFHDALKEVDAQAEGDVEEVLDLIHPEIHLLLAYRKQLLASKIRLIPPCPRYDKTLKLLRQLSMDFPNMEGIHEAINRLTALWKKIPDRPFPAKSEPQEPDDMEFRTAEEQAEIRARLALREEEWNAYENKLADHEHGIDGLNYEIECTLDNLEHKLPRIFYEQSLVAIRNSEKTNVALSETLYPNLELMMEYAQRVSHLQEITNYQYPGSTMAYGEARSFDDAEDYAMATYGVPDPRLAGDTWG